MGNKAYQNFKWGEVGVFTNVICCFRPIITMQNCSGWLLKAGNSDPIFGFVHFSLFTSVVLQAVFCIFCIMYFVFFCWYFCIMYFVFFVLCILYFLYYVFCIFCIMYFVFFVGIFVFLDSVFFGAVLVQTVICNAATFTHC